jgi:hypothetical protein
MHMVYLAVRAMFCAVAALVSTSALAADCGADADEVNAKCYPTLQAAADAALSTDRPLVLPRGTYKGPLVIDYTAHAGTGFELISRGATINGALTIQCASDCFYFHQEGTLFVNGRTDGYLVVIGKPDFSDPQNSIRFDHLIVNNSGPGGGVQLNYVLDSDLFIVADTAGSLAGLALEQAQFNFIHGAASAAHGTAFLIEGGYTFSNTITAMDLEASPVCFSETSPNASKNLFTAGYFDCPVAGEAIPSAGQSTWWMNWYQTGSDVKTVWRTR